MALSLLDQVVKPQNSEMMVLSSLDQVVWLSLRVLSSLDQVVKLQEFSSMVV